MIYITFLADVEPDTPEINGYKRNTEYFKCTWHGIKIIPELRGILDNYHDSSNNTPKISWMLRADENIKIITGKYSYLFQVFNEIWDFCLEKGDEIGWHPHLMRWKNNYWTNEYEDLEWTENMLNTSYKEITKYYCINSSRFGDNYLNNHLLKVLNELKIKTDGTAAPNIFYKDNKKLFEFLVDFIRGGKLKNVPVDWRNTLEYPYHPSKDDYRIKDQMDNNYSLLEIPLTAVNARHPLLKYPYKISWNMLSYQNGAKEKFSEIFRAAKLNDKKTYFMSGYFHPSSAYDLISNKVSGERKHFLAIGSRLLNAGTQNIDLYFTLLQQLSQQFNVEFKFITAKEVINYL
jgi:hypothetical protein